MQIPQTILKEGFTSIGLPVVVRMHRPKVKNGLKRNLSKAFDTIKRTLKPKTGRSRLCIEERLPVARGRTDAVASRVVIMNPLPS
jgi:hypothetical protein